ncbi:MAG: WGR domain-containing protein [Desulfobacterales bacterium]|nr:WGR domain-containing protein [Desulfobacterales bacterium]
MNTERITLYFKQGKSDKVYKASLEEAGADGFVVNFAYGRRGATLKTGTKTKTPVDHEKAKKIYDKLVKSKTSKGYTPGQEGSRYVHTDADSRDTGVQCQLLNFVRESEATRLIDNDDWWAQEKHDGKRMLIRKTDAVLAINRRGLSVGAPDVVLDSAAELDRAYLVDGEAVGERLFVFDLLEIDGEDIRATPYDQRLAQLEKLGLGGAVSVVDTARAKEEKRRLFDRLKTSDAEGIVFKERSAPYTAGRPNSGGAQVKFKFYATASVIVTKKNDKHSVAMGVLDGRERVGVGNVTIPPGKPLPEVDSIIEVRYLYAYKNGSLYQPTFLSERDDLGPEGCAISQLKYKKE